MLTEAVGWGVWGPGPRWWSACADICWDIPNPCGLMLVHTPEQPPLSFPVTGSLSCVGTQDLVHDSRAVCGKPSKATRPHDGLGIFGLSWVCLPLHHGQGRLWGPATSPGFIQSKDTAPSLLESPLPHCPLSRSDALDLPGMVAFVRLPDAFSAPSHLQPDTQALRTPQLCTSYLCFVPCYHPFSNAMHASD